MSSDSQHVRTRRTHLRFALAVAAILAAVVVATWAGDADPGPVDEPAAPPATPTITSDQLPQEALATLELIETGGPFPYSKDGTVFHNYEGLLPEKPDGYYREYTIATPGSPDRGARRIVAGAADERYYTDDHYSTFRLILE